MCCHHFFYWWLWYAVHVVAIKLPFHHPNYFSWICKGGHAPFSALSLFAPFKKAQQASGCFISLFYSIFILIILNIYVFISINLSSLFWELYICCYMSLNFRSTYTYPEWHDQNCFSYIIFNLFFLCYLSFIILLFKNLTCDIMYNL